MASKRKQTQRVRKTWKSPPFACAYYLHDSIGHCECHLGTADYDDEVDFHIPFSHSHFEWPDAFECVTVGLIVAIVERRSERGIRIRMHVSIVGHLRTNKHIIFTHFCTRHTFPVANHCPDFAHMEISDKRFHRRMPVAIATNHLAAPEGAQWPSHHHQYSIKSSVPVRRTPTVEGDEATHDDLPHIGFMPDGRPKVCANCVYSN